jgi:hypothetical protein
MFHIDRRGLACAIFLCAVSFFAAHLLHAAQFTQTYSITLSRPIVSTSTTILFSFQPGQDIQPSSTLDFAFDSGFTVPTSVTTGDGSLSVDSVPKTLGTNAGAGVYGYRMSGSHHLLLTTATDETILTGSTVDLLVGADGGFLTPSATGEQVYVTTFYSSTTALLGYSIGATVIVNPIGVSARVSSPILPPPRPGGGGGGSTDGTPPVISNVRALNITSSGATITWDTDERATSIVDFGLDTSYGSRASSPGHVLNHSVPLTGLSSDTTYHFRVTSADVVGNSTSTSDYTFRTLRVTVPVANVFDFTATPGDARDLLQWRDPPGTAYVRIQARTDGYPAGPTDGRFVYQGPAQAFMDQGLTNGITYYYANYAVDTFGNIASGAFAQATPIAPTPAPPHPPPVTPPGPPPSRPPVPPPTPTPTSTPPVVVPTSTPPIAPGVQLIAAYFGAQGTVQLVPTPSGEIGSLIGSPVLVRVSSSGFSGRQPQSVTVRAGNSTYALARSAAGDEWSASFIPSERVERVPVTVTALFPDGTGAVASVVINVLPLGYVSARDMNGTLTALEGATVTLYKQVNGDWQIWDGTRSGQANPVQTPADGSYGFVVENGAYRIRVEKDGYQMQEAAFDVRENVAATDIALTRAIAPFLNQVANIAALAAVILGALNLATAVSLISLLSYLQFLSMFPFGGRPARWDHVYNSLTKAPLDLVSIRLVDVKTGNILQTHISDGKGRFTFKVNPGTYRLVAGKAGYTSPSVLVNGKADGDFHDLYHGESIEMKEEGPLAVDIPMDPIASAPAPAHHFARLHFVAGIAGLAIALAAFALSPTWVTGGLFVAQVAVFGLFQRLKAA